MTTSDFEVNVNISVKDLKMTCKGAKTYCQIYVYSFYKFNIVKQVL